MKYPFFKQLNEKDCGPTCFRMIAQYYGKTIDVASAKLLCNLYRNGTTMLTLNKAFESINVDSVALKLSYDEFVKTISDPCIVYWNRSHFVVVWNVTESKILIGDPAIGNITYSIKDFKKGFVVGNHSNLNYGIVLLTKPNSKFSTDSIKAKQSRSSNNYILFLRPQRRLIWHLLFSFLISSIFSFIFPFLAQGIVDLGIENKDEGVVTCILLSQIALIVGMCANRFVSGWLMAHISNRVSISMVCHFLEKLMKMKISFFDAKMIGDLLQRIQDFNRIEYFLTSSLIGIVVTIVGFVIYGLVLFQYSWKLICIFVIGAICYLYWIYLFKNRRKVLDYKRFLRVSQNQSLIIHLIRGIKEIKLNNCEDYKLANWEKKQMQIYDINLQGVRLLQVQNIGSWVIDQIKNLIITFLCARYVINGSITMGMMVAISYVIGQLNGPLYQFSSFIQSLQDAQISTERINEISVEEDEDELYQNKIQADSVVKPIIFDNVSFRYAGAVQRNVLNNISCTIAPGKITAVVGESGSGKSTFLKLILGFYIPTKGQIFLGDTNYDNIDLKNWRKRCSVVLQEGYLFTESIAENIALCDEKVILERVVNAAKQAKIHDFINNLPLGYDTIIGEDGMSLSGGQKQRLCIARAIYKNGAYVMLDEATNALDANNENDILDSLKSFYVNRTVIIIAHRLSTIMHADNIIVLKDGEIVECGRHETLLKANGYYAELFKKQLNV